LDVINQEINKMANAKKPEVTKEEIEHAETLWKNFTVWAKWGVIATMALLALMALTLV